MNRRQALAGIIKILMVFANPAKGSVISQGRDTKPSMPIVTLFLCGDVMTGRGIDQVLPHPSNPILFEPYVGDAREYVELAERVNGRISRPVDFDYIWGDALEALERVAPDARIINLETSVTTSNQNWPAKGINYRMNPQNAPCIAAANIDCCALANNHVLDWGYEGLTETVSTLKKYKIRVAGAGGDEKEAQAPAILELAKKERVIVFSFAMESSGVPSQWAAGANKPGVALLKDLSEKSVAHIADLVKAVKQTGDIAVVSLHWGGNWGYRIPQEHIRFAHELIDTANVDVIHGHSSHHPIAMEVYKDKPILYGCGDFLNDYEGIGGYERYRGDLALMYFLRMQVSTGKLVGLEMVPTQIRKFRANFASKSDSAWLQNTLDEQCAMFDCRVALTGKNTLELRWNA